MRRQEHLHHCCISASLLLQNTRTRVSFALGFQKFNFSSQACDIRAIDDAFAMLFLQLSNASLERRIK